MARRRHGKPRKQVRFTTSLEQAEAIKRIAAERGIAQHALIRQAVEAVTGVPSGMKSHPWHGVDSFAEYNRRRRAEEKARREREGARS